MRWDLFFSVTSFSHGDLWKKGEPLWYPLLILKEYLDQKKDYQIAISLPAGVFLDHPEKISIGEGTVIEPGVYIQGPCVIGKRCKVQQGAYIRGPFICGDECHIGHSAEIKNSILLNQSAATHFVYVGDSILGSQVNLGAGVKCANLRLDRRPISLQFEEKKYPTGLKKLGAIIGDRTQIGCNSVLNPGTLIGRESLSYPLMSINGYVPPRSQITPKGIHPLEPKILERLLWQSTSTAPK